MVDAQQVPERLVVVAQELLESGPRGNEQNTKAALITPILEWLGWNTQNFHEVDHEYRYRPSGNPVDYALKVDRTPRLLVEAKGVREDVADARWVEQALSYAASAGVQWVVLTNGVVWKLFNAHAAVPAAQKMLRQCSLFDSDAANVLRLIAKDQMSGDRLAAAWEAEHVDRRVLAVLEGLFSGQEVPARLVRLVRDQQVKAADGWPELSAAQVRASLLRCRAQFDFPAATGDTPLTAMPALDSVSPGSPKPGGVGETIPGGSEIHPRSGFSWCDSNGGRWPASAAVSEGNAVNAQRLHEVLCAAGLVPDVKKLYVNYLLGEKPVVSLVVKGNMLYVNFVLPVDQVTAVGGHEIIGGHWGVGAARMKVVPGQNLSAVEGLIAAVAGG